MGRSCLKSKLQTAGVRPCGRCVLGYARSCLSPAPDKTHTQSGLGGHSPSPPPASPQLQTYNLSPHLWVSVAPEESQAHLADGRWGKLRLGMANPSRQQG